MSSIANPPHSRTLAEIKIQPIDPHTGYASCGCHQRGGEDRWWLCPYHLGVDEGWDERQEMLDTLDKRITDKVSELAYVHNPVVRDSRIEGRIEGLLEVKLWLKEYGDEPV
jgi:hypothetical protein